MNANNATSGGALMRAVTLRALGGPVPKNDTEANKEKARKEFTVRANMIHWFRKLGIKNQLMMTFFSVAFFICLLVIIVTVINLNWLHESFTESVDGLVQDRIDDNMVTYVEVLGEQYTDYFSHAVEELLLYQNYAQNLIYGSDDREASVVWHTDLTGDMVRISSKHNNKQISFKTSVFYTPYSQTDAKVIQQAKNISQIVYFQRSLYRDDIRYLYMGMLQNDLFVQYPGEFFGLEYEYMVHIDEWFYRAGMDAGRIVFQAPQRDESNSNQFSYTLSTALIDPTSGKIIGAIAIEYISKDIVSYFDEIRIMDEGFAALISPGGTVLNNPPVWITIDDSAYKIYDEEITGISYDTWLELFSAEKPVDEVFHIKIPQQGVYHIVRSRVLDFDGEVVFIILLAGKDSEMLEQSDNLDDRFAETYLTLMLLVAIIGLITFVYLTIVIHILGKRYIEKPLKRMIAFMREVVLRSNHYHMLFELDYDDTQQLAKSFPNEVDDLENRMIYYINQLRIMEETFPRKANCWSRPDDIFLYTIWLDLQQPVNALNGKKMRWRKLLKNLQEY